MKTKVLHILNSDEGGIGAFVLNKAIALERSALVFDCLMTKQPGEEFSQAISRMGGKIFIMKNPKKESVRDFFMEIRDFVRLNGPYEMINMHFTGYRAIPFKILALLEKTSDLFYMRTRRNLWPVVGRIKFVNLLTAVLVISLFLVENKLV